MIDKILEKVDAGIPLSHSDAVALLKSGNPYLLFYKANEISRKVFQGKGYVFAQLGINSQKCSGACKFCSLSSANFSVEREEKTPIERVLAQAETLCQKNVSDLFLMTTADYLKEDFLNVAAAVSQVKNGKRLIANVGDFDKVYASALKDAGVEGVYHIVRLREGEDTKISKSIRLKTIDAALSSGLQLYYCVEPIGPEHSAEEIADEMIRARDFKVDVMAAMKRVAIQKSKLFPLGELSSLQLLKIAAVTRLVTMPKKSMNVHEVVEGSLLIGVNQLYAECGVNPRDIVLETQRNRGYSVEEAAELLKNYGYCV